MRGGWSSGGRIILGRSEDFHERGKKESNGKD